MLDRLLYAPERQRSACPCLSSCSPAPAPGTVQPDTQWDKIPLCLSVCGQQDQVDGLSGGAALLRSGGGRAAPPQGRGGQIQQRRPHPPIAAMITAARRVKQLARSCTRTHRSSSDLYVQRRGSGAAAPPPPAVFRRPPALQPPPSPAPRLPQPPPAPYRSHWLLGGLTGVDRPPAGVGSVHQLPVVLGVVQLCINQMDCLFAVGGLKTFYEVEGAMREVNWCSMCGMRCRRHPCCVRAAGLLFFCL